MNKTIKNLSSAEHPSSVNVLGFKEEDEWCALGLEVDIRGYGRTFEEACSDLTNLITYQISFSIYKDQVDLVFHPSDEKFLTIFYRIIDRQRYEKINDDTKHYRLSKIPLHNIISKIISSPQEFGDYQRLNIEHGENVLR